MGGYLPLERYLGGYLPLERWGGKTGELNAQPGGVAGKIRLIQTLQITRPRGLYEADSRYLPLKLRIKLANFPQWLSLHILCNRTIGV